MSPQGVSEVGHPGGCNGTYPLPVLGTACSASDFTHKGLSSSMILRVILFLPLRSFLASETADC